MNIIASDGGGVPGADTVLQDPSGEQAAAAPQATPVPDNQTPAVDPAQGAAAPEGNPEGQDATPPAAPQPSEHEIRLTALQKQFDDTQAQYKAAQEQVKVFEELRNHPAFQEWYRQQQNPRRELPAQQDHINTLRDPAKYAQHIEQQVQARLEAYHRDYVAPLLQQQQQQMQLQKRTQEISEFASKHEDFWDHEESIAKIFGKYPSISPEDAYNLATARTAQKDAVKKAHEVVEMKKGAVVAKPGSSGADKVGQVTVHSDEEAMLIASQYAKKGQKAPRFIFAD